MLWNVLSCCCCLLVSHMFPKTSISFIFLFWQTSTKLAICCFPVFFWICCFPFWNQLFFLGRYRNPLEVLWKRQGIRHRSRGPGAYICKRALIVRKRALTIRKRALCFALLREPCRFHSTSKKNRTQSMETIGMYESEIWYLVFRSFGRHKPKWQKIRVSSWSFSYKHL